MDPRKGREHCAVWWKQTGLCIQNSHFIGVCLCLLQGQSETMKTGQPTVIILYERQDKKITLKYRSC